MRKTLNDIVKSDLFFLYCAIIIGVLLMVLQAAFSVHLFRDSATVYAPMVRDLSSGNFREAFHPSIPCLNVILSAPLAWIGIPAEKALAIVSGLFYVLTIPLVYLLLSNFLPKNLSALGGLCFACAPKIIRFSCSGILDSGKIFFLVAALYLLIRLINGKYHSWKTALLFGCALAGLTLSRSEGFGNAIVFFGCLGLYWIIDSWREKKTMPFWQHLVSILPWIGGILFRILINWKFCDTPTFDQRISNGLADLYRFIFHIPTPEPEPMETVLEVLYIPRATWLDLLNQNLRGGYEVYLGFAGIGLLLILLSYHDKFKILWPQSEVPSFVKWDHQYWPLLLVPLANALIFKVSNIVAYRYFLLDIPCLLVFTMIGLYFAWTLPARLLPQRFRPLLTAAIVAIPLFFQIQNGADNFFSKKAYKQYECGKQIAALLAEEKDTARIWFGTDSIEWYYSGLKRAVQIEAPLPSISVFSDFDYVLWYDDEDSFETIKSRNDLQEIPLSNAGELHLFKKVKI